jgi:hypothetical protein
MRGAYGTPDAECRARAAGTSALEHPVSNSVDISKLDSAQGSRPSLYLCLFLVHVKPYMRDCVVDLSV